MSTSSDSRTRVALMAAGAVLACVLFWPAFKFAWGKWGTDPNYGHGYFIPVASGYLLWRMRAAVRAREWKPSPAGFVFILPAVVLHVTAANAGLYRFSMVAFVAFLAGAIVLFLGWAMLKQVSFPLVFLLFAVPIPLFLESITLPMKLMAAEISVWVLRLVRYTVFREGTIIHLPNITLEVATACSGLRSLALVTAVGAFYGYVTQPTNRRRWLVFLTSIPIAIGANVARIVVTAILSNHASSETARKFYHDFSGIFVFVVAGMLFVVAGAVIDRLARTRLLRGGSDAKEETEREREPAVGDRSGGKDRMRGSVSYWALFTVLVISVFLVHRSTAGSQNSGVVLGDLPREFQEWLANGDIPLSGEMVKTLGATGYLRRQYKSDDEALILYLTYFNTGHGALTHNPEKCYTAAGWTFLDKNVVDVPGAGCRVLQSTVVRGEARKVLIYWYQERKTVIVSKWRHVGGVLWNALLGKPTHSLVVLIDKDVGSSGETPMADREMAFARQVVEDLAKLIPGE